jgi:Rps23 Pro-64 3,4-dihydroxylase Tpa1-like proline 4-hydroxylase
MPATDTAIRISSSHDTEALRRQFGQQGRIQVRNFLELGSADAIYSALHGQKRWNLVYMNAGNHVDADANAIAKWPRNQRDKLMKLVYSQATNGFQYMYATVPIYDIYHQKQLPGDYFNEIFEFLNSSAFLDFTRSVTDDDSIGFADAQATRFDPGHFLTGHDDAVPEKNRRVAYVLSLSPVWRADWGGCLQFMNSLGNIEEAYTPTYNALCMFRVPSDHSVSIVAPFAGASRYSITGWLRSGADPKR